MARSLDWAATPLGSAEHWPPSLKTAANLILAAGFPSILLWGPALVQIYNDAYRELMGGKHPTGMGQPTRECWPEVWHINQPIYSQVLQGETLTFTDRLFPLMRHGYLEQAYFTLCYSPVRDDAGTVAGVLVTVFETTRRLQAESERLQAEENLRESESRLTLALDAGGGVGTWDWDILHDRFYCNARFAQLFSVDPERAAVGAPLSLFVMGIHADDRDWVTEKVRHTVETGGDYAAEYRVVQQDGSLRWVSARGRVQVDEAGTPIPRFSGVVFDISEVKNAESDRKRSAALLQMVIDNVPGLVSYLDPDARYRFVNRHYRDLFRAESLVGQKLSDVIGGEAFRRLSPYLERALAGEPVRFEQFLQYATAQPQYVQVAYSPDRAEDGTVLGVVAMVQDITVQKQMEAALRRGEERLQQVFAQAPIAVAVLRGPDLVFKLANASYRLFFPGRELLDRPLVDAVPEAKDAELAILRRVLETGEPYVAREYLFPIVRDRGGLVENRWFTFVYQPLRELDGSIEGVVVVAVDVTTHIRARQELERANRELEEFAYVASHDLQEPLRMVNI